MLPIVVEEMENPYKDMFCQKIIQTVLNLVAISQKEQCQSKSSILIITDNDQERQNIQTLLKQIYYQPKKEIFVTCGINQYKLTEYNYSTIILLPSEFNYVEMLKSTPTSCQQTIY